jgi:hypothetical protein
MLQRAGAVVVIGGGPSLTSAQVEACRGRARVVAVKEAARLAPWADVLYFCDEFWFRENREDVDNFKGQVATLRNEKLRDEIPGLASYRHDGLEGLCEAADGLRVGHNSGYQAINLAFHMGAKRILLLGLDMKKAASGAQHWFQRKRPAPPIALYEEHLLPMFQTLVAPLARHGVEVLNCSPDSAIACFRKLPIEEALCLP